MALTHRRFPGFDAVRVVALLGVILIHADHWPLQAAGADRAVWTAIDQIARVAVPLFVLLSGALMTFGDRGRTPWRAFARRRLARSLLPWLAWTPVYLAAGLALTGEIPRSWEGVAGWLALGGGHLWFLLLVPQLYAAFLIWPRRPRALALAAAVAMAVQTALCVYRLYAPAGAPLNGVLLAYGFELAPFWIGYFGLGAALGGWIARHRGRPPLPALPFWVAAPAAAVALVGLGVPGAANPDFAQGTGSFLDPLLPAVAVPVFLAVALTADRLLGERARVAGAIGALSGYSLAVYILHEALLYLPGRALSAPLLQQDVPASAAGVVLLVAATLGLALLAARVLAATPLAPTLGVRRAPLWAPLRGRPGTCTPPVGRPGHPRRSG